MEGSPGHLQPHCHGRCLGRSWEEAEVRAKLRVDLIQFLLLKMLFPAVANSSNVIHVFASYYVAPKWLEIYLIYWHGSYPSE